MYKAGLDGLVNTADDVTAGVEKQAGNDNLIDTTDDISLTDFTREIQITDLFMDGSLDDREPEPSPNQSHRQVQSGRSLAHVHADDVRLFILMRIMHHDQSFAADAAARPDFRWSSF